MPVEIKGVQKVLDNFDVRAKKDGQVGVVLVGYTAKYALFIHENMEPKTLGKGVPRPSGLGEYWGPSQYGPKFLEGPLREFAKELRDIVATAIKNGATLLQGVLLAGLRLQRESQLRVPVEYGFLKASAFTRPEE